MTTFLLLLQVQQICGQDEPSETSKEMNRYQVGSCNVGQYYVSRRSLKYSNSEENEENGQKDEGDEESENSEEVDNISSIEACIDCEPGYYCPNQNDRYEFFLS